MYESKDGREGAWGGDRLKVHGARDGSKVLGDGDGLKV